MDKGMVLPFTPLTMTFNNVHYFVDCPPVCSCCPLQYLASPFSPPLRASWGHHASAIMHQYCVLTACALRAVGLLHRSMHTKPLCSDPPAGSAADMLVLVDSWEVLSKRVAGTDLRSKYVPHLILTCP